MTDEEYERKPWQYGIVCTFCNSYCPDEYNDGGIWTAFFKCDKCYKKMKEKQ